MQLLMLLAMHSLTKATTAAAASTLLAAARDPTQVQYIAVFCTLQVNAALEQLQDCLPEEGEDFDEAKTEALVCDWNCQFNTAIRHTPHCLAATIVCSAATYSLYCGYQLGTSDHTAPSARTAAVFWPQTACCFLLVVLHAGSCTCGSAAGSPAVH
jgi:hypothetical protein